MSIPARLIHIFSVSSYEEIADNKEEMMLEREQRLRRQKEHMRAMLERRAIRESTNTSTASNSYFYINMSNTASNSNDY